MRIFSLLAITLSLIVLTPVAAAAQSDGQASSKEAKFSLSAVDSDHGYFVVELEPGDQQKLQFVLRNTGDASGDADVYAADAYTLVNGGFGARTLNDQHTGPTQWLDLSSEMVELDPGEEVLKTVTVTVPEDAEPGEHMTSVVMQNHEPTALSEDGSSVSINQVSRTAIAVLIEVPGPREPALEIGEAHHKIAGQRSVASIEVHNTGNVRLGLDGDVRIEDSSGNEFVNRDASMSVVYAGDETRYELAFAELLPAGDYYVWLNLADEEKGVNASGERLLLHVPEPPPSLAQESEDSGAAGLIQPPKFPGDGGEGSWISLMAIIAGVAGVAALAGVLIGRRRQASRVIAATTMAAQGSATPSENTARATTPQSSKPSRANRPRGLKQLAPSKSSE